MEKDWLATRYHGRTDDINQPLDMAAAAKFNDLLMRLVVRVANEDKRPEWNKGSFFKCASRNEDSAPRHRPHERQDRGRKRRLPCEISGTRAGRRFVRAAVSKGTSDDHFAMVRVADQARLPSRTSLIPTESDTALQSDAAALPSSTIASEPQLSGRSRR